MNQKRKRERRKCGGNNDNENDKQMIQVDRNIGAEGAKMIGEALKSNSTLTKLNLSGDEKKKKRNIKGERGNENDI